MTKHSLLIGAVFAAAMALNINARAQKKGDVQENAAAPSALRVDGKLSEWDAARFITDEDTRLSYLISNDDRNLYLALKTTDREKVSKIIARGITLTVNTDGKKKEGPALTFPASRLARPSGSKTTDPAGILRERLESANEIRISGLKSIRDGGVSTANEYGIQAAAVLDSTNSYTYELAVPLTQLNLSSSVTSPLAVNIRINGIVPPKVQAGPRSPYESMRRGGYGRPSFPEGLQPEDFWVRRTLTNKTN
ncbi:MAG TPA: hypothetical protein VGE15_10225 [Sphingobacteriaceae bacterium]